MTIPNSSTHHNFPNYQGILSRLNRVNDDVRLQSFYKEVAKAWENASLDGQAIIMNWNQLITDNLTGDWFNYVVNNVNTYFKALFWHHNVPFCNWLLSVYQPPEATATVSKSKTKPLPELPETKNESDSLLATDEPTQPEAEVDEVAKLDELDESEYIETLNYYDLRTYAEENGIDISGLRKKDEILEVVREWVGVNSTSDIDEE